jgi:ribosomal protein S18 acetylase RimI-like enzyme
VILIYLFNIIFLTYYRRGEASGMGSIGNTQLCLQNVHSSMSAVKVLRRGVPHCGGYRHSKHTYYINKTSWSGSDRQVHSSVYTQETAVCKGEESWQLKEPMRRYNEVVICKGEESVNCDVLVVDVGAQCADDEGWMMEVARIRAEAFYEESHFGRFTATYIQQFTEREFARIKGGDTWNSQVVARVSSKSVGCAEIVLQTQESSDGHVDEYLVKNVVVVPEYRRCGLARGMLQVIEDHVGQREGVVSVDVELANTQAVQLYESLGYRAALGNDGTSESLTKVGVIVRLSKTIYRNE